SVARKRASMREGPLAELFRATEAAQRGERPPAEPRRNEPREEPAPSPPAAQPEPAAPEPTAAEPERTVTRWLEPIPDNPARLERSREGTAYLAVIRVVGVGGAGLNALDRMIDAGITQVDFVAVNTDIQQLQMSDSPVKVHIGSELTEGLGSGADPEIGRRAAEGRHGPEKAEARGP